MQIKTTRFGVITAKDDSVIKMPDGMLGFESCKRYILLGDRPDVAFQWLQSIDDPTLAFMIINPMDFFQDYDLELTEEQSASIGLMDPTNAIVVTTISTANNGSTVTTNLAGPIVINTETLVARQIVLQDDSYCTKHIIGGVAAPCAEPELLAAA